MRFERPLTPRARTAVRLVVLSIGLAAVVLTGVLYALIAAWRE